MPVRAPEGHRARARARGEFRAFLDPRARRGPAQAASGKDPPPLSPQQRRAVVVRAASGFPSDEGRDGDQASGVVTVECEGDMCPAEFGSFDEVEGSDVGVAAVLDKGKGAGKPGKGKGGGKRSIFGAALLMTGSAVGGGMLAIPAATFPAGYIPSFTTMCIVWVYHCFHSLLFLEANLAVQELRKVKSTSWLSIASFTMGRGFGLVVSVVFVLFSNAVLISQLSRGGAIMNEVLPAIPFASGVAITAIVGATLIYNLTAEGIEHVNTGMTVGLFAAFLGLLCLGLPSADYTRLLRADWAAAVPPIPTVLQVLNFGNMIPVVSTYLDGDGEKIRLAIIIGSFIPLVMVGAWVMLSTALVPFNSMDPTLFVDPLNVLMKGAGGGVVGTLVLVFAALAVYTTILGSILSLNDFWGEVLKSGPMKEASKKSRRWGARAFALIPALLVAMAAPGDFFYKAVDFSGAYLVTFLFGLAPVLMALAVRGSFGGRVGRWSGPVAAPLLPGGLPVIGALFALTVTAVSTAIIF
eukprot:CAMPEP_0182854946 /NCGR_PEP_ID=MMETSP0034_2-20130328/1558_1 /TAXON_ID=156128 /ORGANISM="Nephroselmis pyriformis, Strain CCMP717" /LENGTH=523 /DNA_ID=CAMNT_0024985845 /DNA_START=208 /DNA_END=1780 /DNA_ORIENTATION=+